MESTEERRLDVDDMEEHRLPNVKSLLSMGISAYVIYSSVLRKYDNDSWRSESF